jgi:hypothetical protein
MFIIKFLFFSFTKSEKRRAEQVLPGVLVPVEEEEEVGKRYNRVDMVQIYLIYYTNF